MIVDPQGTRQVYNRLGNTIMVLLHVPLTLIPCLLVTFYWYAVDLNSIMRIVHILWRN
jgi:hypothetical protein